MLDKRSKMYTVALHIYEIDFFILVNFDLGNLILPSQKSHYQDRLSPLIIYLENNARVCK